MILTALFDTKCIVSDAGLAWRRDSTAQHGSTSSRYSPSALHGSLLAACCLLLAACCLLLAVKRKTSRNLNAPSAKRCHPPVAPPGLAQCRAGCPTPLLAPQY